MAVLNAVEIFAEGTWVGSRGVMKWSASDMDEIVENTNKMIKKGLLKPKLKIGHSETQIGEKAVVMEGQEDGDPRMGSISNFKSITMDGPNGKKRKVILADFADIPDIVFKSIQAKLYTDVSAEVEFFKAIGWAISAVALLGADTPAVKGLADLQAFFSDVTINNLDSNARLCFSEPIIKGGYKMPEEINATPDSNASANLQDPSTVRDLLKDNNKLRSDNSAKNEVLEKLKKESKEKDEELEKYKQAALLNKFTEQKEKILAPYKKEVEDKKLMPALFDKVAACLESQKENFTEDSNLAIDPDLVHEIAKAYKEVVPDGNEAEGGGSYSGSNDHSLAPDEVYEREVKIAMGQNKMQYKEAAEFVALTKPEVLQAYTDWTEEVSSLGRIPNLQ